MQRETYPKISLWQHPWDKIKCLMWEDNGFVLYYKALAEERLKWPSPSDELLPLRFTLEK